jgi:rubredoxin
LHQNRVEFFLDGDIKIYKFACMNKWRCLVCGYVYDPQIGDPEGGIPAGTSFEALPDDWVCPQCGAPKNQFVKDKL